MDNDKDHVAAIKADLLQRGLIPKDPVDNFTPFVITAAYVWSRRDQGAMLLKKDGGNRFEFDGQGYSIDVASFPDGEADILGSAGPPANANTPLWDWRPKPRSAAAVAPFDIVARLTQTQPPAPPSANDGGEPTNLEALVAINIQLGQLVTMTDTLADAVRALPTVGQYAELVSAYENLSERFVKFVETVERIEQRQKLGVRGQFSVRTLHLTPPETT